MIAKIKRIRKIDEPDKCGHVYDIDSYKKALDDFMKNGDKSIALFTEEDYINTCKDNINNLKIERQNKICGTIDSISSDYNSVNVSINDKYKSLFEKLNPISFSIGVFSDCDIIENNIYKTAHINCFDITIDKEISKQEDVEEDG